MKALASVVSSVVEAFKHNPRYLVVVIATLMPIIIFYELPKMASQPVQVFVFFVTFSFASLLYLGWMVTRVLSDKKGN
ncbi:hypothetical protein LOY55_10455 [Pseudomonas sp. B21-040]|uniref:hypothetical protein n=1 Tax=unclassified Pseudomonas TaxID=196821 RepID=UPI001CBB0768|nr:MULTISPECIES: hypothetical protein [unclassified Pseudomonas]UVL42490.1 hypothetical protein LOY55_10455 [Pseudomonas sp. B21-040]